MDKNRMREVAAREFLVLSGFVVLLLLGMMAKGEVSEILGYLAIFGYPVYLLVRVIGWLFGR